MFRIYFYCNVYQQRICPEMCEARRKGRSFPSSIYSKCKKCKDLRSFKEVPKIEKEKPYGYQLLPKKRTKRRKKK